MKLSLLTCSLISTLTISGGVFAAETAQPPVIKEAVEAGTLITATAKVIEVNHKEQKLTLLGDDGNQWDVTVTQKAKNFKNIKKGDIVKVEYQQSLLLQLDKAEKGEKPSITATTTKETASVGSKPGMDEVKQVHVTAIVEKVEPAKSSLVLKGPAGGIIALKVKDKKSLTGIKVGDQVNATYTESFAISVEPKPAK